MAGLHLPGNPKRGFQGLPHNGPGTPSDQAAARSGMTDLNHFTSIWILDFEFIATEGDNPDPICMVGYETRSGRLVRLWHNEFTRQCPLESGPETLYVAFYA